MESAGKLAPQAGKIGSILTCRAKLGLLAPRAYLPECLLARRACLRAGLAPAGGDVFHILAFGPAARDASSHETLT